MEEKVILTGEQAKELTDYVERQALERIRYGSLMAEADFYAGAACVIQHLLGEKSFEDLIDIIPPMWILGIFSGRSPSTRWEEDEDKRKQLDLKLARQSRLYQNAELMYEYVTDMYEGVMVSSTPRHYLQERRAMARLLLEDIGLYDFWPDNEEE